MELLQFAALFLLVQIVQGQYFDNENNPTEETSKETGWKKYVRRLLNRDTFTSTPGGWYTETTEFTTLPTLSETPAMWGSFDNYDDTFGWITTHPTENYDWENYKDDENVDSGSSYNYDNTYHGVAYGGGGVAIIVVVIIARLMWRCSIRRSIRYNAFANEAKRVVVVPELKAPPPPYAPPQPKAPVQSGLPCVERETHIKMKKGGQQQGKLSEVYSIKA